MEFRPFQKIARLSRDIVVTEKIDGTNAQVWIDFQANQPPFVPFDGINKMTSPFLSLGEFVMGFGSRTQWITPLQDNHGFARWAYEHREELLQLGPGAHFGEWWGSGIQRGYGLSKGEKRFSLFNTGRWTSSYNNAVPNADGGYHGSVMLESMRCIEVPVCHVVPILYKGPFLEKEVEAALFGLAQHGSWASLGFMNPEGIVVFHSASGNLFKKTLDDDAIPKSLADKAKAEKKKERS